MGSTRETSTDYSNPHRPRPIALANRLGRAAHRLGWAGANLSERSLIDAARRRTGLHDFGDDDHRRPFRKLLEALESESRLTPIGRFMARENLIRMLVNRLRIEAALDVHPEILEIELEPPVVVSGLQRTGTTVVHRQLAQDPGFRHLASWEAINPAPLPGRRSADGVDPRVRSAQTAERGLRWLAPDFFAIHPVEAESPEEDCLLFDFCFMSTVPEATQQVPTFSAWLEAQDHLPAYRYVEKVLKYLQWQRPGGPWVLKSPHHLEHLDAIFEVFPEATTVQTHRDPLDVVPSFASMMSHAYGVFSDHVDPHEVGRRWLRKQAYMVDRALEARDELDGKVFVDVRYTDLVRDPVSEMRRVYERVGRSFDGEVEATARRWMTRNPQHKHGRHMYSLETFGIGPDEVREAFAGYIARFGLDEERAR